MHKIYTFRPIYFALIDILVCLTHFASTLFLNNDPSFIHFLLISSIHLTFLLFYWHNSFAHFIYYQHLLFLKNHHFFFNTLVSLYECVFNHLLLHGFLYEAISPWDIYYIWVNTPNVRLHHELLILRSYHRKTVLYKTDCCC